MTHEALHDFDHHSAIPSNSADKESTCNARDSSLIPGLGRSSGDGIGFPLQYSCLENPHGLKSLAGYSSWGCQELDMTELLSTALAIQPEPSSRTAHTQGLLPGHIGGLVLLGARHILSGADVFLSSFPSFFPSPSSPSTLPSPSVCLSLPGLCSSFCLSASPPPRPSGFRSSTQTLPPRLHLDTFCQVSVQ